jgi:predicted phage terminase large subunit-like protein
MQRTHQNDLCGYLQEREKSGAGSIWDKVVLPAIALETDKYREKGQPLQANRYDLKELQQIRQDMASDVGAAHFETQYQQNPTSKETQIFHEEWFRYFTSPPRAGRLFIAVDPAFSKKLSADQTAMVVGRFIQDEMYIEEIVAGRYDPHEFEDKLIYLIRKWQPEKVGIEAVQAQATISFSFKTRLQKEGLSTVVEDIKQKGDKTSKIKRLQPLYRNGKIFHKRDIQNMTLFEDQLKAFPRGSHDDMIDAAQMLYELYTLQPDVGFMDAPKIKIVYDDYGKPMIVQEGGRSRDF